VFLDFGCNNIYICNRTVLVRSSGATHLNDFSKSVLFVDDEPDLLRLIRGLLEEEGFQVLTSESAEEALAQLKATRPDIILADIKLPAMDGFQLYEQVRKTPGLDTVPFVFVTAYNDQEAIASAKALGASDYVTKPFDFELLIQTVKRLTAT